MVPCSLCCWWVDCPKSRHPQPILVAGKPGIVSSRAHTGGGKTWTCVTLSPYWWPENLDLCRLALILVAGKPGLVSPRAHTGGRKTWTCVVSRSYWWRENLDLCRLALILVAGKPGIVIPSPYWWPENRYCVIPSPYWWRKTGNCVIPHPFVTVKLLGTVLSPALLAVKLPVLMSFLPACLPLGDWTAGNRGIPSPLSSSISQPALCQRLSINHSSPACRGHRSFYRLQSLEGRQVKEAGWHRAPTQPSPRYHRFIKATLALFQSSTTLLCCVCVRESAK